MSKINKNILPEVLAITSLENEAKITLFIDGSIEYFHGHFPNAPVLPGVVQLDWAIHFARQELTITDKPIKNVEVLKFQVIIQPELEVELQLVKKSSDKFTFKYVSEKGTHASGRVVLEDT